MKTPFLAPIGGGQFKAMPANASDGVVEIGLLLPSQRAAQLLQLAQDRHESVGQLLRKLIDREIARSA
jgi:hypothetical protein